MNESEKSGKVMTFLLWISIFIFSIEKTFKKSFANPTFSYNSNAENGPQFWGDISSNCDGSFQSPINLDVKNIKCSANENPLTIDRFDKKPLSIIATNTGHTYSLKFNYADGKPARFIGGPLKGIYNIDSVHWHWGANDKFGSEHTVAGKRFTAEAHFVSYNAKYGSFENAMQQPDGLSVLAILYEWTSIKMDNPFKIYVNKVLQPQSMYQDATNLFSIKDILKTNKFHIYAYRGSLSTPNCYQTVLWMVSKVLWGINSRDLSLLRTLTTEAGTNMVRNNRPLQKVNGRKIVCL